MGYYSDLGRGTVAGVDAETGYPVDDSGHLLDPVDPNDPRPRAPSFRRRPKVGTVLLNLTSPYGFLTYAVGSGDDFHCFDYKIIDAGARGKFIILHSVINSETGSFIQDSFYLVLPINTVAQCKAAFAAAISMTDAAFDWAGENEVELDEQGWNQDGYLWLRTVAHDLFPQEMRNFDEREMRFGGKRIEAAIKKLSAGVPVVPYYMLESRT